MPDDPKPLSPEEVDALERAWAQRDERQSVLEMLANIPALIATVRDRERQRDNAQRAMEGDGPCYYCGKPVNNLAGNPGLWSVGLCHADDPGVVKWHHVKCVSERLGERDEFERGYQIAVEQWQLRAVALAESERTIHELRRQLTLQTRIAQWAEETFGPATAKVSFRRFDEEDAELALNNQDPEEAADIVVTLMRWAAVRGFDLLAETERKLEKCRKREWIKNGDGTGHRADTPAKQVLGLRSQLAEARKLLGIRTGCRQCKGTGIIERHQPGHTHYETDLECPPYHFERSRCPHCSLDAAREAEHG